MGNIKHYVDEIKNGNVFFDEKMKMTIASYLAGILHAIFLVLSIILGVLPFIAYSAVAIAIYFGLLPYLVKKGKSQIANVIMVVEVTFNAALATVIVGRATGFHIYVFSILPACFYLVLICDKYKSKELASIIYSVYCFLSYIVIYILSKTITPLYTLTETWQIVLMFINITGCFILIVLFLFLIEWDVLYRNASLATSNSLLNEMANKDTLTKLFNRRFMNKKLEEKVNALHTEGTIFGIIMGDIDNFKKINDTYGHESGDEVLVGVAEILAKSVRDNDYVCRWGGEEFLIIINGNKTVTSEVAERMRQMISEKEFILNNEKVSITMTFGVSESIPGYNIDKLVQVADDNLYKGKQNGKNQVVS